MDALSINSTQTGVMPAFDFRNKSIAGIGDYRIPPEAFHTLAMQRGLRIDFAFANTESTFGAMYNA